MRDKVDEMRDVLFPPIYPREGGGEVDDTVDGNLEAVIIDLESGRNDPVVHKTLNSILSKLVDVRRIIDGEDSAS